MIFKEKCDHILGYGKTFIYGHYIYGLVFSTFKDYEIERPYLWCPDCGIKLKGDE